MTRSYPAAGVWALALAVAGPAARGGEAEDLARLGAANTAAVEAIRTLHCKVRFEADPWDIPGGEYWRSGDKQRVHFTHKGHPTRAAIKDGVVRYDVKQDIGDDKYLKSTPEVRESLEAGRYYWHGAVELQTGASPFLFNPWSDAKCVLHADGKDVPFTEFVRIHRQRVRGVRRAAAAGVPTEAVEFRFDTHVTTVHLDPAAGHMVRRFEWRSDSAAGDSGAAEVASFKQGEPGVFFPERVVLRRRNNGTADADRVATFTDIAVNKPIPDSTFDFKFRHGITVTDRIQKTKYKVNENGVPLGKASPMPVYVPPPPPPGEADLGPGTETREEPRRAGWWLLPVSLAVLAAAAGVVSVRRLRRRRADHA